MMSRRRRIGAWVGSAEGGNYFAQHRPRVWPCVDPAMRLGGAAFLLWYGARSARAVSGSMAEAGLCQPAPLAAVRGGIALIMWAIAAKQILSV